METLCVIPARGGSKGIPRKNVRLLAGKPLLAHALEKAHASRFIDRVVVSTDDPDIAQVARSWGADVIHRPPELSTDTASSESALLHALDTLAESESYRPDVLVFIQCTAPLMTVADVDRAIETRLTEDADVTFTVSTFYHFLWRQTESGDAVGINHDKRIRPMRQQREPQFVENGAIYCMKVDGFLQARHRFFGKTVMVEMPPEHSQEIDEPLDFQFIELMMREQMNRQSARLLPDPLAALVLDFDGVFTDNKVLVFDDGHEAVLCNRGDGYGIEQLRKIGLPILVLSKETNPVVRARCAKLGLPCIDSTDDKLPALQRWLAERQIDLAQVVYVGNDLNDLACVQAVGCGVAVADAHPRLAGAAAIVLQTRGGDGAIRELAEMILQKRNS